MLLTDANKIFKKLKSIIKKDVGTDDIDIIAVGSIRRKCTEVGDIDILIVSDTNIMKLIKLPDYTQTEKGKRRCRFVSDGVKVDIFYSTIAERPYALLHHTGDATFNIKCRRRAMHYGYKLNQYGIFDKHTGTSISEDFDTEKKILKFINVKYRSPSKRI